MLRGVETTRLGSVEQQSSAINSVNARLQAQATKPTPFGSRTWMIKFA